MCCHVANRTAVGLLPSLPAGRGKRFWKHSRVHHRTTIRAIAAASLVLAVSGSAGCSSRPAVGATTPAAAAVAYTEAMARNKSTKTLECNYPNPHADIAVAMQTPDDATQTPTVRAVTANQAGHWTVTLAWLPTANAIPFTVPIISQGKRYVVCWPLNSR